MWIGSGANQLCSYLTLVLGNRAEGNWDLCYQIQTPEVSPNKEINATSVCQVQGKGSFVSTVSFQLGALRMLMIPNNLQS